MLDEKIKKNNSFTITNLNVGYKKINYINTRLVLGESVSETYQAAKFKERDGEFHIEDDEETDRVSTLLS